MGDVPGGVVKIIELVGSSPSSFSDAVRNAVKVASQSVRNITGVDVIGSTAVVGADGELTSYKVHCKVAFLVEAGSAGSGGEGGAGGAASDGTPATRPPSDS